MGTALNPRRRQARAAGAGPPTHETWIDPMLLDALYHATVAGFFTHELDAVKRHEWRVLPLVRRLPERAGEQVFIWTHVPLFFAVFRLGDGAAAAEGFRLGFCAFAAVHVGLHRLFRNHPAYEFNNPSSWGLILLTGALGAAYLVGASV